MAGTTFSFTGKYGVIGVVAAVLLIGYRVATLDAIEDPALDALVSAELAGGAASETGVTLRSIRASSPLLSFSSSPRLVLKVDYEIVKDGVTVDAGVRYFRARHQRLTRTWRLTSTSASPLSYYMNFL